MTTWQFNKLPKEEKLKLIRSWLALNPNEELVIRPIETTTKGSNGKGKYRSISPRKTTQQDVERMLGTLCLNRELPYRKAFNYLQYKHHPILAFNIKAEELYAKLDGPLSKFPTKEKHFLVKEIKQAILNMMAYNISIWHLLSTSSERIKQISAELCKLSSLLSTGYRMSYISKQFHAEVSNQVLDLTIELDCIQELTNIQKKMNKGEVVINAEEVLYPKNNKPS